MRKTHFKNAVIGCLIVSSHAAVSVVEAQEGDENFESLMLDEVVVTARKREESLQDSPVAISAFSAESLREAGVSSMTDLSASVPGLTFSSTGSKAASIFIRGVGQRESNAALDPSVGVYINGVFIARTDTQLLDTVDTESVQVLRGPQGTLFGKNTTGGALLVTTKSPNTDAFSGTVGTRVGNFGRRDAKAFLNIPLNDETLSMRVGINSVKTDGYMKNVVDGRGYGDEDRLAATARVLWEPTDSFSADLFTYMSKQNENGAGFTCLYGNPNGRIAGQLAFPGSGSTLTNFRDVCEASERLADDDKVALNSSTFQLTNQLAAVTLSWDLDDYEIKNITSFGRQSGIVSEDDQDGTGLEVLQTGSLSLKNVLEASGFPVDEEKRSQIGEEINLIGSAFDETLSYTIGAFYSQEKMDNAPSSSSVGPGTFALVANANGADISSIGLGANKYVGAVSNLDTETYALFAQGTLDITDWFQLTIGARYTAEKRERTQSAYEIDYQEFANRTGGTNAAQHPLFSQLVDGVVYGSIENFNNAYQRYANGEFAIPLVLDSTSYNKKTWEKFTPAITLSFNNLENYLDVDSVDSFMTYVTVSEGFKAGGFEPKGAELAPFDPEEVTNYEFGAKLDAFGNRLRVNSAIYYMDYRDLQVRIAEAGEKLTDVSLYLSNIGEATIKGYELEIFTLPAENLSVVFTYNYTQADYKEFETPNGSGTGMVDRSDEPFGGTPEKSGSIAVSYNIETESAGLFVPRITAYYRDELYVGLDYLSPDFKESTIDSYSLIGARLSWMPDDQWNISAFVDNLTDKDYYAGGYAVMDALGASTVIKGPPRTYGIEVYYDF